MRFYIVLLFFPCLFSFSFYCVPCVRFHNKYRPIKTAEQRTIAVIWDLGGLQPRPDPSCLYQTVHPSTASVPTSYYSMWQYNYLCTCLMLTQSLIDSLKRCCRLLLMSVTLFLAYGMRGLFCPEALCPGSILLVSHTHYVPSCVPRST